MRLYGHNAHNSWGQRNEYREQIKMMGKIYPHLKNGFTLKYTCLKKNRLTAFIPTITPYLCLDRQS